MVISGFFTNSRLDIVMEIVEDMERSGHFPDKMMFATIMDANFKAGQIESRFECVQRIIG